MYLDYYSTLNEKYKGDAREFIGSLERYRMSEKRKKNTLTTKQLTKIAMMVAFISAMSYVRIPLPFSEMAVTGQTLAVNVIALLLTPLESFVTMICYWLLGMVGAPVFGGMAGPGKMLGPGGGYFAAFMLAVVLIAKFRGKAYHFGRYLLVTILVGIVVIDGIGFLWMKLVTEMTWEAALLAGVVVFVPLDVAKCLLACVVVKPLRRAFAVLENDME